MYVSEQNSNLHTTRTHISDHAHKYDLSNFFQKFVWTLRPIEWRALKYFLYVILCSKDLYKLLPFNRVLLETMNMNVK